jgi:uncharacterized integral membrane protein (TIGR00698 family)
MHFLNMKKFVLTEDWATVVCAALIVGLVLVGVTITLPAVAWTTGSDLLQVFSSEAIRSFSVLFILTLAITVIGLWLKGEKIVWQAMLGFVFIYAVTLVAYVITGQQTVKGLGLEIVLFSLLLGLFISNVLYVPSWVKPFIQTELYVKIGLILLGTSIIFQDVLKAGSLGLLQSVMVVLVVWQFSFWLCKQFKLDDELRTMLSSAVAICGVSAAIATAGAIKGDGKKLSYVISLVLITAIPMMILMPYAAKAMNLSPAVAGAWLGGTIDTTGAVVAAGTVLGEEALTYATVVKFSQNVLLGLAAFAISIYWTITQNKTQEKPSVGVLWERFPKFVIGFIVASLLFSFVLPTDTVASIKGSLKSIQTIWFALAFTCIGLETKFTDIFKLENGKPAYAFLIAQLFNVVFTLLISYVIFEWW